MTNTKHTPAPWKVNGTQVHADNKHESLIADVFDQNEACKANARLIAAAPELLEALEIALEASTQGRDDKSWEDAAIAAIAKAKAKGE